MLYVATGSSTPVLVAFYLMEESPRWLIQRQRYNDAAAALNRIAKWNGQSVRFTASELKQVSVEKSSKKILNFSEMARLFKDRKVILYIVALTAVSTAIRLTYAVIFMNIQDLAGNPFVNVGLFGALRIWSPIAIILERKLEWFGRRLQLFGTLALVLLSFVLIISVYASGHREKLHSLTTAAAFFAFTLSVSLGDVAFDQIVIELFPTVLRASANALLRIFGAIGVSCGPQLVYLRNFWPGLPYVGAAAVTGLALLLGLLILPETKHRLLPDTVRAVVKKDEDEKETFV